METYIPSLTNFPYIFRSYNYSDANMYASVQRRSGERNKQHKPEEEPYPNQNMHNASENPYEWLSTGASRHRSTGQLDRQPVNYENPYDQAGGRSFSNQMYMDHKEIEKSKKLSSNAGFYGDRHVYSRDTAYSSPADRPR